MDPTTTAIGTWSGGRFMHFGEPLDDARLEALLRPGEGIDTVISADAYGAGEADRLLGKALEGVERESYCLIGAIGHDFYEGEREGAKGFPRFTDPRLRASATTGTTSGWRPSAACERLGAERFDLLLLHNPDRTGYRSEAVWAGMEAVRAAGLTRLLGVAPGPANGFTLDLIDCFERFGELIDWAMVILTPMEPWPGELVLDAAARERREPDHARRRLRRPVPRRRAAGPLLRRVRPPQVPPRRAGSSAGREKLELMRPYADATG